MLDVSAELGTRLEALVQTGTEEEVKKFVIEHFLEFPENVQEQFAMAMFEDALGETVAQRTAFVELKKKAVETIGAFENVEKAV